MRRRLLRCVLCRRPAAVAPAQELRLPMKDGSVKFAVIGDTGTGDNHQLAVPSSSRPGAQVPVRLVVMMGDNLYGGDSAKDYEKKFEHRRTSRCSTAA